MKGLVFIALALLPFGAWAQKPVIEFETTSHNFGTIGERGGKVAYDFVFRNTGDSPLLIRRVQAGCGCTSTDWPRQPILPQRTDTIRVYFDPIGRPGKFIKCITVNSNSTTPVVSLTVRGMVRGEAAGPYDSYNCRLGDLYLEQQCANLGAVLNTGTAEQSIGFANARGIPCHITTSPLPPYLHADIEPQTAAPGGKGRLHITYDAEARKDWGFSVDSIALFANGKRIGQIYVTADIQEDFNYYGGDYTTAPKIFLEQERVQLEDLPRDSWQTCEFYIENKGKSDLVIRKMTSPDRSLEVEIGKGSIRPGKRAKATARFYTGGGKEFTKVILIISNDPRHPKACYRLDGTIK